MWLNGQEECEICQGFSDKDRSPGNQKRVQLEQFVSWKGMGPEHSEWLCDNDLTMASAAELVCRITWTPLSRRTGQLPMSADQLHQLQVSLKRFLLTPLLPRCLPREADLVSRGQVLQLDTTVQMLLSGYVSSQES